MTQYSHRKNSGRVPVQVWLDAAESHALADLATLLQCTKRDAVAYAIRELLSQKSKKEVDQLPKGVDI